MPQRFPCFHKSEHVMVQGRWLAIQCNDIMQLLYSNQHPKQGDPRTQIGMQAWGKDIPHTRVLADLGACPLAPYRTLPNKVLLWIMRWVGGSLSTTTATAAACPKATNYHHYCSQPLLSLVVTESGQESKSVKAFYMLQ